MEKDYVPNESNLKFFEQQAQNMKVLESTFMPNNNVLPKLSRY